MKDVVQYSRCRRKSSLLNSGRPGLVLGYNIRVGDCYWTPVLWDNKKYPEYIKSSLLDFFSENTCEVVLRVHEMLD